MEAAPPPSSWGSSHSQAQGTVKDDTWARQRAHSSWLQRRGSDSSPHDCGWACTSLRARTPPPRLPWAGDASSA